MKSEQREKEREKEGEKERKKERKKEREKEREKELTQRERETIERVLLYCEKQIENAVQRITF